MLLCKEDIHSITHNLTCLEKSEFCEFEQYVIFQNAKFTQIFRPRLLS